MEIFRSYRTLPPQAHGASVALGNFDGVHRGHRAVIAEASAMARGRGRPLGVLVFEPHPRRFFAPETPPFRLTALETKARLLSALGVDALFALTFDEAMAAMSPQDFVFDILIGGLRVSHVVAGEDFRFGRGRAGDMTMLSYMGDAEGFGVTAVAPVFPDADGNGTMADGQISSSSIRTALREGRPQQAARLLGRPWTVEGVVAAGDQRGRTIGFPTANVPLGEMLHPALGVYAVLIEVFGGPHGGVYEGVANLGRRPTFDKTEVLLEAHVFDFAGDLYDTRISVALVDFLRPEKKFDGLEALKTQIAIDADSARAGLANARAAGILPRML
ncbi:MAG: bifunctional riboflavin kinase/FAD synthetase [Alphaproteobacteria bacterium]